MTARPLKHLLLDVPAYGGASTRARSYFRLGAVPIRPDTSVPAYELEPGWDLAKLFADPTAMTYYADDDRDRDGTNAPGHKLTVDQRQAKTATLHTDGGWRDHTDGNRISTTRGDKLEVIGGNYRLMVLGRAVAADMDGSWDDVTGQSAGLDMSGGIIRMPQATPGGAYEERWSPSKWDDGTWTVTTHMTKGDLYDVSWGDRESWTFAKKIKSYTGKGPGMPTPEGWSDFETPPAEANMPQIDSGTWATRVGSQTHIAGDNESTTEIGALNLSNTVIGGLDFSHSAIVGGALSISNVGVGKVDVSNVGGFSLSASTVAMYAESHSHVGGLNRTLSTVGSDHSISAAADINGISLYGSKMALSAGLSDMTLDLYALKLGLSLGIGVSVHIGVNESLTLPEEKEIKISKNVTATKITATLNQVAAYISETAFISTKVTVNATNISFG